MKLAHVLMPAMALAAMIASAQNLDMATGDTSTAVPERPTRGSSMSAVEARFGTPVTKHAAVGEPPITRWDYPQFSVFFERDKVLHAVIVHAAPAAE
jgi:hypothetical protein